MLNVLGFLNIASVVQISSTALYHKFELRRSIFTKIEEIDSRPATLPKKACIKEVFL